MEYYDPPPTTEDKDETSNVLGDDGDFVDAAPFSIGDYLYEGHAGEYTIQNDSPHVNTNANETFNSQRYGATIANGGGIIYVRVVKIVYFPNYLHTIVFDVVPHYPSPNIVHPMPQPPRLVILPPMSLHTRT